MARGSRRPAPKAPKGYVTQKGRFISVVGLVKSWAPGKAALHGFDPDMRVTSHVGGLALSFPTPRQAKAAFDRFFGDLALGLADALPDNTTWVNSDMQALSRRLSKG